MCPHIRFSHLQHRDALDPRSNATLLGLFLLTLQNKMFGDWCGLDFRKYAFPLIILGSLALHVWDITSDVLVTIVLYNEDIVYFGISIGIMVLGSLYGGFIGLLGPVERIKSKKLENKAGRIIVYRSCLFGLTQLGIFVEAYYSIRLGKKTHGFAYTRFVEAMAESTPQALLQLYIVLKRADGVIDTNDMLVFASIGTSFLSMAVGLSQFEKWHVNNSTDMKEYFIPTFSKYFIALNVYHLLEIAARMTLLACFGMVLSGWVIGASLLVDYVLIFGIHAATSDDKCNGAAYGGVFASLFTIAWVRIF